MEKLTKKQQLELFDGLFGSFELIDAYIESGAEFCKEAQIKLCELDNNMPIAYIKKGHTLCNEAQLKLFTCHAPLNEILVSKYLNSHFLCPEAEPKLCDLPMGSILLANHYLRVKQPLTKETQIRLLEMKPIEKAFLCQLYVRNFTQDKMVTKDVCPELFDYAKKAGLLDQDITSEWDKDTSHSEI